MLTFAIGDIHGCLALLVDLLRQIERAARHGPHRIVCLGDLIDRGPDSAGVVRMLRDMQAREPGRLVCLKGNHEDLMLRAARRDASVGVWLANGGRETLESFGAGDIGDVPADILAWIEACPTFLDDGRRYFVHAGLNPASDREHQRDADRLWIREVFLESDHDFGRYVVHGHTPIRTARPDARRTRLNIDTAAAYGGRLTAAIFTDEEDRAVDFLQAG
ncbi:metallophosphoesterase family protein [uncultured Enterovirga sp.]|uniref:metallophosphoesterase family protein n=1 Tax=uncultured Enterovirga sp. TaxID=2026352 RepID=UPI0035CB5107